MSLERQIVIKEGQNRANLSYLVGKIKFIKLKINVTYLLVLTA